ncbi:unnamed protein product [Parnassius mnemosyne]|uniref:Uncharacterized protein n=1 Tax=Parnassius mnemosyne TaxID=213953 RepID=A0AAV1L1C5_9NEOP
MLAVDKSATYLCCTVQLGLYVLLIIVFNRQSITFVLCCYINLAVILVGLCTSNVKSKKNVLFISKGNQTRDCLLYSFRGNRGTRNINKRVQNLRSAKANIATTLSPRIQAILSKLKDSPLLKEKLNYKLLMKQLKQIFHTTSTTVCSKCKLKQS